MMGAWGSGRKREVEGRDLNLHDFILGGIAEHARHDQDDLSLTSHFVNGKVCVCKMCVRV